MRRPSYLTASIARFTPDTRVRWPHERASKLFWWLLLMSLCTIGLALCFVLKREAEATRELERVRSLPSLSHEPTSPAPGLRFTF